MVPDAAECGAISRRCRVARRSPRWCGGDCRARSCGPGGTARSAVPAQPIGHLSKRHHQFHLSWPEYWDRTQGLTDPSKTRPHSLFRQGCMLYELIPNMPEHRLLPLIEKFAQAVSNAGVFIPAIAGGK